jgi:polysaccharide pyruvyl transferase WcaK-like protein
MVPPLRVAFFDVTIWLDFLKRFDFVVGTRIYGAMLAMQVGIPAAVIAHDSGTYEMCTTMVCRSGCTPTSTCC